VVFVHDGARPSRAIGPVAADIARRGGNPSGKIIGSGGTALNVNTSKAALTGAKRSNQRNMANLP
jgi:hypothetical protein